MDIHGVPLGTFAVGWGQVVTVDQHGNRHVTQYGTPFTEAGLQTNQTPEPGTLFLLGSGLLGVGTLVRRKLNR